MADRPQRSPASLTTSGKTAMKHTEIIAARAERALHDASEAPNKLNLSDVPYTGREVEIASLQEAFDKLMAMAESDSDRGKKNLPPRVISISGAAGTGKSSLAQELRSYILDKGGFFITGKFDQHRRGEAYTGLATAMNELVQQILARDLDMGIRRRVRETVQPRDGAVLSEIFPSLTSILADDEHAPTIQRSQWAQRANRRHFLFQQFVSAILSPKRYKDEDSASDASNETEANEENPLAVVMVLDDVQWIDQPSLDLVSSIVRDTSLQSFLLVTTNRPLTEPSCHPFSIESTRWRSESIFIQTHYLENLGAGCIRSIVASVLVSDDDSMLSSLAETIHQKTSGNPFFAIEFLKALVEKDLLTYSFSETRWKWNCQSVQSLVITQNGVGLLTEKLKKLPPDRQLILCVAASLGLAFEKSLIEDAINGLKEEESFGGILCHGAIGKVIEDFVDLGFLDLSGNNYFFVHDLIKQAAIDLVETERNTLMRLRIGQHLLKQVSRDAAKSIPMLLLGVDLCNGSLSLLTSEECLGIAHFNFLAGERALQESAFSLALRYMEAGLLCLEAHEVACGESDQLVLKLLVGASDASYCQGNLEMMNAYADKVLSRNCEEDLKMSMLFFKIIAASAQHQHGKAIEISRAAIKTLGMGRLPQNPSAFRVRKELLKTKIALRKHTKETLERLPILTDKKRIAAMKIIDGVKRAANSSDRNFLYVSFFKSFRWSLQYGISVYSPDAFLVYAVFVNSFFGDVETSIMLGEVAFALCERLGEKEATAKCSTLVFAFIHHWSNGMRSCYQPLQYSHKLSMECGDVESAMLALWYIDLFAWCTSQVPLQVLGRDLQKHCKLCQDYKYFSLLEQMYFLAKSLSELCDKDDENFKWLDSLVTVREVFNDRARNRRDPPVEAYYNVLSLQTCYLLQNSEESIKWAKCTGGVGTSVLHGFMYVTRAHFYRGLTFLAFASNGENSKRNLREAKRSLKLLNKWCSRGNTSCNHMVALIEAEMAQIKGQNSRAKELYSKAITSAKLAGCIHDVGTSHECAATFYLRESDHSKCAYHIKQSIACFLELGADAKVRSLRTKHADEITFLERGFESSMFIVRSDSTRKL